MKIAVFEVEAWEREAFERLGAEHEVTFTEGPLEEESVDDYADAEVISTFIYSELDRAVLDRLSNLRMIATRSTGVDHIDLDYCRKEGVAVCNVPHYGENTVAEHALALLLAISHRLVEAVDRTRRGDFSQQGLRGFDLEGKTLGVVGTGSIGAHVVRIARGFGMSVLAFDLQPNEALARELGAQYVTMERLLTDSDVITLHVPLNEETRHMIDREAFERMKDGVVLINTARGAVVDVTALVQALGSGKVAAAGLDVLPAEPTIREEAELLRSVFHRKHDLETLLADHILLRMRNVLVTPHSAFNTREAVQRILDTTVENIMAFAGGKPQNVAVQGND